MIQQAKALTPHIRNVIQLADAFNMARDAFNRQHGTSINIASPEARERYEAYRNDPTIAQARDALIGYVNNNLTDGETDIVRAIMYIGRDERGLLREMENRESDEYSELVHDDKDDISPDGLLKVHYRNIKGEPKDRSIKHMMEKVPLPDYLRDGLKILGL